MRIDPTDFGLNPPVQIESLKIWFYWGMGSFEDSVFTFKIYDGDGQTLLFESESIACPRTYWVYYGLDTPVSIDSGDFYICVTARLVNPYAHPYINVDESDPTNSFYGSAGSWTACTFGEYCFFAFVRELPTGTSEGKWTRVESAPRIPGVARHTLKMPDGARGTMFDPTGRPVLRLEPGLTAVRAVPAGVYFVQTRTGSVGRVVVLH